MAGIAVLNCIKKQKKKKHQMNRFSSIKINKLQIEFNVGYLKYKENLLIHKNL